MAAGLGAEPRCVHNLAAKSVKAAVFCRPHCSRHLGAGNPVTSTRESPSCRACGRRIGRGKRGPQRVYCSEAENIECVRARWRRRQARKRAKTTSPRQVRDGALAGEVFETGGYSIVSPAEIAKAEQGSDDDLWRGPDEGRDPEPDSWAHLEGPSLEHIGRQRRAEERKARARAFLGQHRQLYRPGCRVVDANGVLELRDQDGTVLARETL